MEQTDSLHALPAFIFNSIYIQRQSQQHRLKVFNNVRLRSYNNTDKPQQSDDPLMSNHFGDHGKGKTPF